MSRAANLRVAVLQNECETGLGAFAGLLGEAGVRCEPYETHDKAFFRTQARLTASSPSAAAWLLTTSPCSGRGDGSEGSCCETCPSSAFASAASC